jgi:hypothetical protein
MRQKNEEKKKLEWTATLEPVRSPELALSTSDCSVLRNYCISEKL